MRKRSIRFWWVWLTLIWTAGVMAQETITQSRNNAIVQAVRRVSPSVVSITSVWVEERRVPLDDFWRFFYIPQYRKVQGLGSGIIIDPEGFILTNQHVIGEAQQIEVTLPDGQTFPARVIGDDYLADLALLKVDATRLPSAALGNSDDILIGEWAIAIGNPFASFVRDPHPTVTVGVISATNRILRHEDRFYYGLIQTDAAINPGNSGGALANARGQVIGINTAIFSTSGGSQGLGFAIPINTAKKIIQKLRKYGMVLEPDIGLEYQELTPNIAEYLELPVQQGVIVSQVHKGSLAEKAGLRRLDVIQAIDGHNVNSAEEAIAVLRLPDVGDTVEFRILRDGRPQTLRLRVDRMPQVYRIWGLTLVDVRATSYMPRYRRPGALVVRVEPDSPMAGIKKGDLIYGFSKRRRESYPVRSLQDFIQFVERQQRGDRITIHLERNGGDYYIPDWRVP